MRRSGKAGWRSVGIGGRSTLLAVALLGLLSSPAGLAAGSKGFAVTAAATRLERGVYYLDANLRLDLDKRAHEALANGVALTFVVQIHVVHGRKLLWNATIAELNERYRLSYRPLSQSYSVENLNSGAVRSYDSLSAALAAISEIRDLPLIDADLLDKHTRYLGSMRVVLDTSDLPAPLRLMALVVPGWQLESPWHQWVMAQ